MKQKTLALLKRTVNHELVTGSFLIFVGTMAANVLAFVFNFILLHKLTVGDYGTYSSLVALLTLAGIPSQALIPVIVQFATNYFSHKEEGKAVQFYFSTFKAISLVGFGFFLGFWLFSGSLSGFLHISNPLLLVFVGGLVFLSYLTIVNTAYLQSLLKFGFQSLTQVLSSVIKVTLGTILLFMGFKIIGSLWTLVIAFLGSLLISFIPLQFLFSKKTEKIKISWTEIVKYAVPTMIAVLALTSLTSTDVILVKHFFTGELAGVYSGFALIGKIIFYFTYPIPLVMFPLVIKRVNNNEKFHNLFFLALIIVIIPSAALTGLYFLFPQFLIHYVANEKYLPYASLLGWMGLFLTLFSIINVMVLFFLSLKKTNVVYFVGVGALAQIIGILLFHTTLFEVIMVSLAITIFLLISLLIYYWSSYGKKN